MSKVKFNILCALSAVFVLFVVPTWSATSFVWDQTSAWPDVRLSPEMRQGAEQIVLKPYGPLVQRYDEHSQPAIGFRRVKGVNGFEVQSVPQGFWHDPETDEVYVAMQGGGGLTILNPWTKTSVTYRNDGIWDTSEGAEGVLLRNDWQFTEKGSSGEEAPILFQAMRRKGSRDIFVSNAHAFLYMIRQHDPDTFEDDELIRDFWKLGFLYESQPELFQDEEGLLYIGGRHGEGFHVLHPDQRTLTRYDSRDGAMLIRDGTTIAQYDTPKLASMYFTRPLFKGRDGALYLGTFGPPTTWLEFSIPLMTAGNGLIILKDFDAETQRYTMSLNYRTTGLWNTTEQVGLRFRGRWFGFSAEELMTDHLISRTPQLPGGAVYSGWEDEEGRVYLGTSGGLAVLYPDGRLESPAEFQGRAVFSTFQVRPGDLYLNTSEGLEVWYADGTVGILRAEPGVYPYRATESYGLTRYGETLPLWLDREGNLNAAILGEGIEVYGLHREGTATSPPVDLSAWRAPQLLWEVESTAGTSVRLQVRTGAVGDESSSEWSAWRDVDDPQGAPIVAAEASHTWGQWRAVFAREDKGEAPSPSLRGVWIEESPSTAVEEKSNNVPEQTALYANYPNPFNAETVISYQLSQTVLMQLTIYNIAGQPIRHLDYGLRDSGVYNISWDGRDDKGGSMGSGVYLVRLIAADYVQTRRILLLK